MTLPIDGYEKVVRLVTGGLASRLGFGFETVDDLQLAIELVLRSLPGTAAARRRVSLTDDGRASRSRSCPVGRPLARAAARSRSTAPASSSAPRSSGWSTPSSCVPEPEAPVVLVKSLPAPDERDREPAPTSEVDRRALLRAYRENGDLAARDRLVEGFMPLVVLARAALRRPRRAARGSRAGRLARPREGDRPLRPRPRGRSRHLHLPDRRRRAEAPLPRPGLVGHRAAPARRSSTSSSRGCSTS